MSGLVYGVGVNDAGYAVSKHENKKCVWRCPFYMKWVGMLKRCYSEKTKEAQPSYEGCTVCEEWLVFSSFKSWMEKQDWEGKSLDKDLLIKGNKVYRPDACVFVSSRVNNFLIESNKARGEFPIGASWYAPRSKFTAHCGVGKAVNKNLGYFDTAQEAHKAWLSFKTEQAYILAAEQADPRISKAIIERYENYVC